MELINVLSQLILFFIFFSIGTSILSLNKNIKVKNLSYSNQLVFNVAIQINLIIFLSFLALTLSTILTIYLIYLLVFSIIFININFNNKFYLHKNRYLYFLLALASLVLFVDISNSLTLGWDSQKFWFYKTLNFYNGGTIQSLQDLPQGDGYNYPYLGSLLWAVFWKLSFISEEYSGRLLFAFLYALALFSLTQRLNISQIGKSIAFIILILLSYKYDYFGGEQDILIFSLIAFSAPIIHEIISYKKNDKFLFQITLLLLIFNALIWTKAEGVIYTFIMTFILIFFSKIQLNKKIFLIFSVIFLSLIKIFIYKFYNLNIGINSCCWNDLSLNAVISKISFERIITIIQYFFYSFLKNSFLILGSICFVFSFFKKGLIKRNLHIYTFFGLNFAFIFSAYILTDAHLIFMLKTGLDRLLFSTSPFFIIIIIEYFNSQKIKF